MGYTTDFEGKIYIDEPVPIRDIEYINSLFRTRRMKRNVDMIKAIFPDWSLMCYNGVLGIEGEFFVHSPCMGQLRDESIEDYNDPPSTQPGLWCSWVIVPITDTKEKTEVPVTIEWNGAEKFYSYTMWLEYIFLNFFKRPNYHPYGVIFAQGEDPTDAKYIIVEDGVIKPFYYTDTLDDILSQLNDERVKEMLKELYKDPDSIEDYDDDDW